MPAEVKLRDAESLKVVPLIDIVPTAPVNCADPVVMVPLPLSVPPSKVKSDVPPNVIAPWLLNVPPFMVTLPKKLLMVAPVFVPSVPPESTVKVSPVVAVLEDSSVSVPPLAIWMGMLVPICSVTGLLKASTFSV